MTTRVQIDAVPTSKIRGKPSSIELFGMIHPVTSHLQAYMLFLAQLQERDPEAFASLLKVRGTKRTYITRDPSELVFNYRPLGDSGYYVDTNMNPRGIWQRARKFLHHLGYSDSDLAVIYD